MSARWCHSRRWHSTSWNARALRSCDAAITFRGEWPAVSADRIGRFVSRWKVVRPSALALRLDLHRRLPIAVGRWRLARIAVCEVLQRMATASRDHVVHVMRAGRVGTGGASPACRHWRSLHPRRVKFQSRWQSRCRSGHFAAAHGRPSFLGCLKQLEWSLAWPLSRGLCAVSMAVALLCLSCFGLSASGLRSAFRFRGSYGSSLIFQSFGFCATDIAALIPRHAGFIAIVSSQRLV